MTKSPIVANEVSTKVKEVGLPGNCCLPDNKRQTGAHLSFFFFFFFLSLFLLPLLPNWNAEAVPGDATAILQPWGWKSHAQGIRVLDSSWNCCSSPGRHPPEHVTCEKNKLLFLGLLIPNHPWKEFRIIWTWEGERLYHFYKSQTWDEAFPSIINMGNRPEQYQWCLQTLFLEITGVLI